MSETTPNAEPEVVVLVTDERARGRIAAWLEKSPASGCRVSLATHRDGRVGGAATLFIGDLVDKPVTRPAVDYVLPLDCDDERLRTAVELLAKLAALRSTLAATHRHHTELARLAATDPLTGLANRRTWDAVLQQLIGKAALRGDPLTLVIADLDGFKTINDRHGLTVGDAVLRATADGLRQAVRRGDLAARIGGDEFGLLLPMLGEAQAGAVVQRIRRQVTETIAAAALPPTTCSIGYAVGPCSETGPEGLYAAACAALRKAKQERPPVAGP